MTGHRERKRSRVDALEGDVSALETQIAELQVRQAENADLAQQNRCRLCLPGCPVSWLR